MSSSQNSPSPGSELTVLRLGAHDGEQVVPAPAGAGPCHGHRAQPSGLASSHCHQAPHTASAAPSNASHRKTRLRRGAEKPGEQERICCD